jgi:hypothetical protein
VKIFNPGPRTLFLVLLISIGAVLFLIIPSSRQAAGTPQGKGGEVIAKATPTPTPRKTTPKKRAPSNSKASQPAKSASEAATAAEMIFWNSIKDSTNPDDFKVYLKKFPNGEFADLAKNRLKTLEAAKSSTNPSSTDPNQTNPNSTNKETDPNAKKTMESNGGASEADIIAKEKVAWDAIKKKDWDGLKLAGGFINVEDDGVYDREGVIASMTDFDFADVTFSEWKMLTIDKDAVILIYNLNEKATYKGHAIPSGPYRAAAAYVNRNGQWLAIYYQQTLVTPAPSPLLTRNQTNGGSPESKAGETGADAVANEKLVWDALKNGNYEAFASYLSPDFIEVEANGVFDKAGTVKKASIFDASKAELSEFRSVKFDNDAYLVTYLVKLRGIKPDQERHTAIWVNRNGKWMALFHQGTTRIRLV